MINVGNDGDVTQILNQGYYSGNAKGAHYIAEWVIYPVNFVKNLDFNESFLLWTRSPFLSPSKTLNW